MRSVVRLLPALLAVAVLGATPRLHGQDEPDEDEMRLLDNAFQEARQAAHDKEWKKSSDAFEKFFARLEKTKLAEKIRRGAERTARYDYACVLAAQGKKPEAVKALARAIDLGYWHWKFIDEDKDLDPIRKEPGFADAIDAGKLAEKENDLKEYKESAAKTKEALAKDPPFAFDFQVTTIDSKTVTLSALKGKVVIVDVWGTWCPPCREEIPHFVKLYESYKAQGLEIVGLTFGDGETPETVENVKAFALKNNMKYPLAIQDETSPVVRAIPDFGTFPMTIFVDREGKVRAREIGYHGYGALEGIAKTLLEHNYVGKKDGGK